MLFRVRRPFLTLHLAVVFLFFVIFLSIPLVHLVIASGLLTQDLIRSNLLESHAATSSLAPRLGMTWASCVATFAFYLTEFCGFVDDRKQLWLCSRWIHLTDEVAFRPVWWPQPERISIWDRIHWGDRLVFSCQYPSRVLDDFNILDRMSNFHLRV